ncbi:hypothetical protein OQ486_09390 [Plesiomonas shigelloides]|uniref:hypothetical protein n=1 Tax=Plesiomonas shigelloides TaxID=703 RepID=UPI0022468BF3|nr:hypothetical protein [Plesiomonas shigelloides]MCX2533689.1 hypothetical protein [Plesiomonas shigelloides]
MGKGGGSNEIQETEAQKAAADIASQQWNLYKNELSQFEDMFMDKVDDMNSQQEYDKLAGTAALGTAQAFGEVRQNMADSMASAGIDPTSGRYQDTMRDLETEQALSQTDTTNRAQSSQQDKYVAGLKDVVAMGSGQKAEALQGYSDLATNSLNKAASDAQRKWNDKQSLLGAVGTAAGMATRKYGLRDAVETLPKTNPNQWAKTSGGMIKGSLPDPAGGY